MEYRNSIILFLKKWYLLIYISTIAMIAGIGIAVFLSSVGWMIESTYNNTLFVSISIALSQFAIILSSPIIGHITDHFRKDFTLFIFYSIAAISLLISIIIIKFIPYQGFIPYIIMIVNTCVLTLVRAADQNIRTAIIHENMDKENYIVANKVLEFIRQGIVFFAGGIAMIVIKYQNLFIVILFNLICIIIACLITIYFSKNIDIKAKLNNANKTPFKNVLIKINQNKINMIVMGCTLAPYVIVLSINALYPVIFMSISKNPSYYAALSIPYGIGALLGSYLQKSNEKNFVLHSIKHIIVYAIALIIMGSAKNIIITYASIFTIAYCHCSIRVQRNNFLMLTTEKGMLGRVTSIYEGVAISVSMLISLLYGVITNVFNYQFSLFLTCIFLFIITTILFFIHYKRKFIYTES